MLEEYDKWVMSILDQPWDQNMDVLFIAGRAVLSHSYQVGPVEPEMEIDWVVLENVRKPGVMALATATVSDVMDTVLWEVGL
jgi:hypothetical protein